MKSCLSPSNLCNLIGGVVLLGFGLMSAVPGQAADWYARPLLSGGAEYNDNPSLSSRTDEASSTAGYITQIAVTTGFAAETMEGWVRPRLRFRRYPSDSEFDSEDVFADFDFRQRFARSDWGFRGTYSREQIRTAELAEVGLDPDEPDIPDEDTGIVDDNNDRSRLRLFPRWDTRLTEKTALRFQGRLYDVSYDDDNDGQLSDYTDLRGEFQHRYSLSRVTTWITGVFGRDFDPSDRESARGYGLRTGFEHFLTPTTRLRVLGGIEHSDPDEGSGSDDWIADVSLSQRLQTTWFRAGYRRSVSAQGDGDLSLRDQINLGFTRELTELLEAGIGVRAYTSEGVQGNVNDRDYVQIRTEFIWNLTSNVNVVGDYRYTLIDRDDEDESANANQIFLYLNWGFAGFN